MVAHKGEGRFAAASETPDAGSVMGADVKAAWIVMAALFLSLFLLV